MLILLLLLLLINEIPPESGALNDLDHDEGVKDDDGHVRDDLHEYDLAPKCVKRDIELMGSEVGLAYRGLISVRPDVSFHLEKLKRKNKKNV